LTDQLPPPEKHIRAAHVGRKLPELSTLERHCWVEASEGMAFAALAELVICV
jgi:hypothetical protein